MRQTVDVKTRILLPLILTLAVVLAGMVSGIGWLQRKSMRQELARTMDLARTGWDSHVADSGRAMAAAAPFICGDRKTAEAFQTRSRARLYAQVSPVFARLRQDQGVTDVQFLDPSLVTVLRVHNPKQSGDAVTHAVATQARQTGETASGLEVTAQGTLTVRTVQPWRVNGRVIGYLEIGQEIGPVVRHMRQTLGVELCILVDKARLPRVEWERSMERLGRSPVWDQLPAEAVVGGTWDVLSPETAAAAAPGRDFEFGGGRRYYAGAVALYDAAGQPIGRLLLAQDVTARYAETRKLVLLTAGLSLAAVLGLTLFLFVVVRRLRDRLQGAQQQLAFEAHHDSLTGLPNRRKFIQHLDHVIRQTAASKERAFAVLFLDFDRFKVINDSLGHEVGDVLLQAVAARLRTTLAQTPAAGLYTIGRLGGDEFVVLLDPLPRGQQVAPIADRLLNELSKPYQAKGHEVHSTVSIGVATSDGGYANATEIIRDADTAMYRAKTGGRGRFVVFERPMREESVKRLEIERDLSKAVERNELRLYYQPIVLLETGKLIGFESLVRWQHPTRGFVSPADFIPIAEETGQILSVGNWVLEEGCRQLQLWRQGYPELDLQLSVNLSRKQLCYPDLVERVQRLLVANAIPAGSLKLEITESTVMEHGTAAVGVLQALQALGVNLWMDDFGTGYSSLSCLHRFPLNGIKVDRAFIRNVSERRDYAAVVHAIVSLAGNLGMQVVAEGVETAEQVALLKSLDCHLGQGYFFSKPVDPKAAEALIQKQTPLSRAA